MQNNNIFTKRKVTEKKVTIPLIASSNQYKFAVKFFIYLFIFCLQIHKSLETAVEIGYIVLKDVWWAHLSQDRSGYSKLLQLAEVFELDLLATNHGRNKLSGVNITQLSVT